MRQAFAHDAVLRMAPNADTRAPGAAITVALCGHWDHRPPCRLPHHTSVATDGDNVHLRILFASEPGSEPAVRARIESALSGGRLEGPDAVVTQWTLRRSGSSDVHADELEHAHLLVNT